MMSGRWGHLPALSREGDRIIFNIKRVAHLFLTKNAYSLFFILFAGFVGLEFPLSPRFITWIDVLTIGTPAFFLTLMTAPVPQQTMDRFFGDICRFALAAGLTIALASLVVYASQSVFQDPAAPSGRTAALSVIILLGLCVIHRITAAERAAEAPAGQRLGIWAIIEGALGLHMLAVYWTPLRDLLGMALLDAGDWGTIIGAAAAGAAVLHWVLKRRFSLPS